MDQSTNPERLIEVVSQLSSARELPDVTAIVRKAARALTSADGVTFVLREAAHCYYADEDAIAPLWKGRRFPIHTCVSGWVMRRKLPAIIPDIYADPRVPQDAYRSTFVRSMAMVPVSKEEPVAAIGAYWAAQYTATPGELRTLTTLADSASLALANVKLYEELRASLARERHARTAAEAEMAAKDQFLAVISHELRQPLQAAVAALELMSRRSSRERGIHARTVVERQIRQMSRVVDDLLESSRIVRGVVELKREAVDLREIVRDAIEATVAPDSGRRVDVDLPDRAVLTTGDPSRLRQVFQNLMANAVKFSGVEAPIEVRMRIDASEVVVAVKDYGVGIAPAALPTVFDLFVRASDDTSGFGIGLAVVRRLVELHGGTVSAHSAGCRRGTEFIVRLPLDAPAAATAS